MVVVKNDNVKWTDKVRNNEILTRIGEGKSAK